MKLYGEISKTEEQSDGTIKVWGYASSGAVDSDGETITSEAMKAALPDYMKFGAVREMHQSKAAGTAIEASVDADGRTFFGAHIVDSEAVKKVKANVYKGFSIGGKVTERDSLNKTIIKGLKLVEVSLVDRPANPEAIITIMKADSLDADFASPTDAEIEKAAVDVLAAMLDAGDIKPSELIALAKAAKATSDNTTEMVAEDVTVTKGMYGVSDFAQLLSSLSYIISSAEYEAQSEGDDSPVPEKLRAWMKTGIGIFGAMAAEECTELMASLAAQVPPSDTPEVIAMAAAAADLAKAGSKFSAATCVSLAAVHAAAQACCDHLDALGYNQAPDEEDKAKASATDDLTKVQGDLDLAKAEAARLSDDLTKAAKELADYKARPAPGKALLMAITKGADALPDPTATANAAQAQANADLEATLKGEALAQHQIRKIFQNHRAG